ncbi:hypothetical protein D9613_002839 [Agrocybe pediades]|uniref:Uncharacterized protein n=1 Tax=Agrocybe pediades TaxID=84607 RepID=A0A8H4QPY0_9AGAR|nr:hypothetical protein D9613_002839 [Agrocybe pediades]
MLPNQRRTDKVTFDLVVVGAGGGPDETNLSAYLVKPHEAKWEHGILALEAGSGQGTLSQLLRGNPQLFGASNSAPAPSDIYSYVRQVIYHINSLIISAGSLRGPRKRVFGLKQTLKDLELVFSDRIWPNLASWEEKDDEFKLLYTALRPDDGYTVILPDVAVLAFPLNHGRNAAGQYTSTAYFIRHEPSQREFLFFGDVEPDSVSHTPQTVNVWRAAAPKIPELLSAIFIECSWPSGRPDDLLFGHLTPEHLGDELVSLATEVVKFRRAKQQNDSQRRPLRKRQKRNSFDDIKNALAGVRIFVVHCKDDTTGKASQAMRTIIGEQVRRVVEEKGLGAEVLTVVQGTHIAI